MESAQGGGGNDSKDGFEQEFSLEFKGSQYILVMTVTASQIMTIEVESVDTNDRWSGDFTAQYAEEITQKAGSYKKFEIFVKMLASAFAKDSDSVFVDLLTYSDLEMLKARKLGTQGSATKSSSQPRAVHLKRYIILTYSGEFDKVHYPLPLNFEETPNAESLKKSIRRLRKQLQEKFDSSIQPASDRERELRLMVNNMRQENQELRHKCRQLESRLTAKIAAEKRDSPGGKDKVTELEVKLKKQVDHLKRELVDATAAYDKLRVDARKEISKWKSRQTSIAPLTARSEGSRDLIESENAQLRSRVHALEQDIKKLLAMPNSNSTYRTRPSSSSTYNTANSRSYGSGSGGGGSGRSYERSRSASPSSDQRLAASIRQNRDREGSGPISSSSLGKRFDPTAYQRERQKQIESSRSRRRSSSRESGYSSAGSNASTGSGGGGRARGNVVSRSSGGGGGYRSDSDRSVRSGMSSNYNSDASSHKDGERLTKRKSSASRNINNNNNNNNSSKTNNNNNNSNYNVNGNSNNSSNSNSNKAWGDWGSPSNTTNNRGAGSRRLDEPVFDSSNRPSGASASAALGSSAGIASVPSQRNVPDNTLFVSRKETTSSSNNISSNGNNSSKHHHTAVQLSDVDSPLNNSNNNNNHNMFKENVSNRPKTAPSPAEEGSNSSRMNPTFIKDEPEMPSKVKSSQRKSSMPSASSSEFSDSIQYLTRSVEKQRESQRQSNTSTNASASNPRGDAGAAVELSSSISNLRDSLKAGNLAEFSRSASKSKLSDSVDSDRNKGSSRDTAAANSSSNPDDEMGEIDRRIKALQNYLDKARSGILNTDE